MVFNLSVGFRLTRKLPGRRNWCFILSLVFNPSNANVELNTKFGTESKFWHLILALIFANVDLNTKFGTESKFWPSILTLIFAKVDLNT